MPDTHGSGWGRVRAPACRSSSGAIVVVVLVGGGAAAWAVGGWRELGVPHGHGHPRRHRAEPDVVGTVEPVNDASASFQVAGQVATVTATVGQQVTAGESSPPSTRRR